MRKSLTRRMWRLWLSLGAAGAIMAAVAIGVAATPRSPEGDEQVSYSSSQTDEDEKFVALRWGGKPDKGKGGGGGGGGKGGGRK